MLNPYKKLYLCKRAHHPRYGVTFIEIIIAMVLIGIIFATFLVSIGNLLIHNTKTNTILEFMYHTSQGNQDPAINNVGRYLDDKANLITAKKRLKDLEDEKDKSNETKAEIEARKKEIAGYIDHLNTDKDYSHNVLFPKNVATNERPIYEMNMVDLDRGVAVANLNNSKNEYLKASWYDGKNKLEMKPDNATYRFAKAAGGERLYSLVSLEVMTTTLPKQKPTQINREFIYPTEVGNLEMITPWSPEDAKDEDGFLYFTYWYSAKSDQTGADATVFTDTRGFFNQPEENINELGIKLLLTTDLPSDIGRFKRLNETKDKKRMTGSGDLLAEYGGSWIRFGVQPIYGYAGAAYPAQFSSNACYVIPLPDSQKMRPAAHYNPSYMGLLTKVSDQNKYSNLIQLSDRHMGEIIEGTQLRYPTYKEIYENVVYEKPNNKPTGIIQGNVHAATYIPVLTKAKRPSPPSAKKYAQPIYNLLDRSLKDPKEKNLDDMFDNDASHEGNILPLESADPEVDSCANVIRKMVKTANCGAARVEHISQGDGSRWQSKTGLSYSAKILSINNLKVDIKKTMTSSDYPAAVGLTFYAFDCNQNAGKNNATGDERWTAKQKFETEPSSNGNYFKIKRGKLQEAIKKEDLQGNINKAELNRHTLISGSSGELGYFIYQNSENLLTKFDPEEKNFVCVPYLKVRGEYYLPKTPEGFNEDDAAYFYTLCPYDALSSVMIYHDNNRDNNPNQIWINGYPVNFGDGLYLGQPLYIGGGKGNLNLTEILTYGKNQANCDEAKLRLVHAYMTLGRVNGKTLKQLENLITNRDMDKYPKYELEKTH